MAKPSIHDVAAKAGVTVQWVSRVLDGRILTPDETRKKVVSAVRELKYTPPVIDVFFTWIDYKYRMDTFWRLSLLKGLYEVSQENHAGVLINTIVGEFDPGKVSREAASHSADGVLVVSPQVSDLKATLSVEGGLPTVFIGFRPNDPAVDYVDSENISAASQVVDHLVDLGHERIACITGDVMRSRNAMDRLIGFQLAMERHGLPVPEGYVASGDFLTDSGESAMKRLLGHANRPTAVFASNDSMALGALKALEAASVKAGTEIALVGYDDIPEASRSLTTVRQDHQALGEEGMRTLLEKIHHEGRWKPRHIHLPARLIVRGSSGPARKG